MVVHHVVIEDGDVRPRCGDWAGSASWSTVRGAVTCPRCRELLERPTAARPVG